MQLRANNLREAINKARKALHLYGQPVTTINWQGKIRGFKFIELLNLNLLVPMQSHIDHLKLQTEATEWAVKHFEERVGGKPLNPPPSHSTWSVKARDYLEGNKFSHSYPERLWPKTLMPDGIRFKTADLNDAINLLKKDPTTRQCYIPIYFPEDLTAANEGQRVPCTLGWHFIVRDNKMHCFYPMRSCDALRHFHNDLYLANRLGIYIKEKAGLADIEMGNLSFSCTSFHCFENDRYALKKSIIEEL
jgi:thymidylate synthase